MAPRFFRLLAIVVLCCALSASFVSSVGLSTYNSIVKQLDFQPGGEVRFPYRITPTTNRVMDYGFTKSGDMADYVLFDPPTYATATPGQSLPFDVVVRFPQTDENLTPGMHTVTFGVQEQTPPSISGNMGFSASTSVQTAIRIRVLSGNKSVEAGIAALPVTEGGDLVISTAATSWSKLVIDEAYMTVRILDEHGKILKAFATEKRQILPGQAISFLPILWSTLGIRPGVYTLEGTLHFDGYQDIALANVKIGELTVTIEEYTKTLTAGKINQLMVMVASNWNHPLADMYYTLESAKGKKSLRSPTFSIEAFDKVGIPVFWDATSDPPGAYDVSITAHYAEKETNKKGTVSIIAEEAVQQLERPAMLSMLAIVLLAIILLALLISNLYWFKRNKERERKEKESQQKMPHDTTPPQEQPSQK